VSLASDLQGWGAAFAASVHGNVTVGWARGSSSLASLAATKTRAVRQSDAMTEAPDEETCRMTFLSGVLTSGASKGDTITDAAESSRPWLVESVEVLAGGQLALSLTRRTQRGTA
jgi:hypothetical protein